MLAHGIQGVMTDLANITANIRVDRATQRGSVIDVIRMIGKDNDRSTSSKALESLRSTCPELMSRIQQLRINGKGRLTPCADARTLVEIVWLLPGKAAREFRRTSAATVCRALGGDLTLAAEIESRHNALQTSEEGRTTQRFLTNDEEMSEPTSKRVRTESSQELQLARTAAQQDAEFEDWLEERRFARAERQAAMMQRDAERQMQTVRTSYEFLESIGALDARDKIAHADVMRRLLMQAERAQGGECTALAVATPLPPDDPRVPTPECHELHRGHEVSMHSVAGDMRCRIPPGKEGAVGKRMRALYASRYGEEAAKCIPKRTTLFRGKPFSENTYWSRDNDLMRQAVESVL
jgi:hypothetical protein